MRRPSNSKQLSLPTISLHPAILAACTRPVCCIRCCSPPQQVMHGMIPHLTHEIPRGTVLVPWGPCNPEMATRHCSPGGLHAH